MEICNIMINLSQEQIMQSWDADNADALLVSVHCTAYNHEPYIAQTLDGFLMQKTSFPFEVIVHDDASTDRTAEIIRDYEARFPKIIKPIYETENQYSKRAGSLGCIIDAACVAVRSFLKHKNLVPLLCRKFLFYHWLHPVLDDLTTQVLPQYAKLPF